MTALNRFDWDHYTDQLHRAREIRAEAIAQRGLTAQWESIKADNGGFQPDPSWPTGAVAREIGAMDNLLGWKVAAPTMFAMTDAAADLPTGGARKPVERNPREAEAREYLKAYAGTWQFMLTLKAELALGKLRFTDRVIEVILNNKARETAWAEERSREIVTALKPAAPVQATEGWYEVDGSVVKVQKAVHGSGNLYAKRLVVEGLEADRHGAFWQYEPGLIRKCNAGNKLSLERAQEMGKLYGVCMVCGAILTDETSIERGIGPICYGKLEA